MCHKQWGPVLIYQMLQPGTSNVSTRGRTIDEATKEKHTSLHPQFSTPIKGGTKTGKKEKKQNRQLFYLLSKITKKRKS